MPEGHAIHRLATQFAQVMSGEVVAASSPQGRFAAGTAELDGQRLVGIVTERDLVLPDQDGDLHIPHYINLFGGTVFLIVILRKGRL